MYHQIARNKRKSVIVIVAFFLIWAAIGYVIGFIAYRMPGTDSPDYAAAQVLGDVLASQRGDLYAMVPAGKGLAASSTTST